MHNHTHFSKINGKWMSVDFLEYLDNVSHFYCPSVFVVAGGGLDWAFSLKDDNESERLGPSWVEEVKAAFPELSATATPAQDA